MENMAELNGCLYYLSMETGEQWFNWPMIEAAACDPSSPNHDTAIMFAAARTAGMDAQRTSLTPDHSADAKSAP